MACLSAGTPMVALPLGGGDQAGNAHRCTALGVARIVPAGQRTPDAIRAAVRDVLTAPSYRERAEQLRDQIRALPGPAHAVKLLEHLAAGAGKQVSTV
jgi:UDP:flavonoid glycosyltransferase YjiC (YdhE family)